MSFRMKNLLAAAFLGALSLQAQEPNAWVLSAGLLTPHGDALDMTQQTFRGYAFEVGYAFHPEGYGASFLAYCGHLTLPGKNLPGRATYDMAANLVGIDLVYRVTDKLPLTVFGGPSLHQWQVQQHGVDLSIASQGDENWKYGFRVGLGYRIAKDWELTGSFTQTLWRSRADLDYVEGLNPSKPAYWSFMANYRF